MEQECEELSCFRAFMSILDELLFVGHLSTLENQPSQCRVSSKQTEFDMS